MRLCYEKIIEGGYIPNSDNWETYGEMFEYEPDENELTDALMEILIERYFRDVNLDKENRDNLKKGLASFIRELSIGEQIQIEEDFRDELTEKFEKKAYRAYKEEY